ncbi:MAG: poly-gamma-glutamate hydrolase family protein [bacterium]|nr:poly-gamma-glutamate hydrolase family protein [bacterium]
MAKDTYNNFKDLKQKEKRNQDYGISICNIGSPVTIIAPHGGKIEPQTSYIANRIAGDKFNFYGFEGIKPNNNRCLHITSHKFDEPQALNLIAGSRIVLAIHACTDSKALVYPGGRDEELVTVIVKALKAAGITVADRNAKYQGLNSKNICNRGVTGKGAQLEISRGLRDDLDSVHTLCDAIHAALQRYDYDSFSDIQKNQRPPAELQV